MQMLYKIYILIVDGYQRFYIKAVNLLIRNTVDKFEYNLSE